MRGDFGPFTPRQPTTWLHISGYRFLLRRVECALLGRDIHTANEPLRAQTASLAVGCVLAALAVAGCGLLGFAATARQISVRRGS